MDLKDYYKEDGEYVWVGGQRFTKKFINKYVKAKQRYYERQSKNCDKFKKEFNDMEWYVWHIDWNTHELKSINIFKFSVNFISDLYCLLHGKCWASDKTFAAKLDRILAYAYRWKAEYEFDIYYWIGDHNPKYNISIYDQVKLNWNHFLNYVKKFRKDKLNND